MVLSLPVELLLHVGRLLSLEDLVSLATTSKAIRSVLMKQVFGKTAYIRSPLPDVTGVRQLFDYLQRGMPGLRKCIEQVTFYRQYDLARHVRTVRITNWIAPCFWLTARKLAEGGPEYQTLLEIFEGNEYYFRASEKLCWVYDYIVLNLVQIMPFSELELIRTHITPIMHSALNMMPNLQTLTLEDCTIEEPNVPTYAGHGGRYTSFKVTSKTASYLSWNDTFTKASFIPVYLFLSYSTLTKLEICIEFLRDDALDRLSLPSLTYLAIVPHTDFDCEMWSWGTVYRILKSSPNITCFRFEPLNQSLDVLYPFEETSNWGEYKRNIGGLPLSQLSSITAYRQLVRRLVPGRPVSFVKILLFPDTQFYGINWPGQEDSDNELGEGIDSYPDAFIVPYQLLRSTTPVKTLYMQRIDEQVKLEHLMWVDDIYFLHYASPFVTDLWLSSLELLTRTTRSHYRDPMDAKELLQELIIWRELERCAIGNCSPWMAKELEWSREGTIMRPRVHPTLEELLFEEDVLWKWHDDSEVTGWVLYVSTDLGGSEDSEEAIYPPCSLFADSVSSDSEGGRERSDSIHSE